MTLENPGTVEALTPLIADAKETAWRAAAVYDYLKAELAERWLIDMQLPFKVGDNVRFKDGEAFFSTDRSRKFYVIGIHASSSVSVRVSVKQLKKDGTPSLLTRTLYSAYGLEKIND